MQRHSTKQQELFDGPFKVPLPRKLNRGTNFKNQGNNKIRAPKPQYKFVSKECQKVLYQKLLVKLLHCPETITKYDMKILATHPVINQLLKRSKDTSLSNANFYIPIESLLDPQMYANVNVPVIYETPVQHTQMKAAPPPSTENDCMEDELADDSTSSSHDCEEFEEKRVGKYTLKERQEKILKYKKKLQRFREGKSSKQVMKKTRKYNRLQPRKNGKFSSYNSVDQDDFTGLIGKTPESPSVRCSQQFFKSANGQETSNLNEVVSEITGIF